MDALRRELFSLLEDTLHEGASTYHMADHDARPGRRYAKWSSSLERKAGNRATPDALKLLKAFSAYADAEGVEERCLFDALEMAAYDAGWSGRGLRVVPGIKVLSNALGIWGKVQSSYKEGQSDGASSGQRREGVSSMLGDLLERVDTKPLGGGKWEYRGKRGVWRTLRNHDRVFFTDDGDRLADGPTRKGSGRRRGGRGRRRGRR